MDDKRITELVDEIRGCHDLPASSYRAYLEEMLDEIERLQETLDTLMNKRGSRIRTHWDDCWKYHGECAIAMVERLQAENADLKAKLTAIDTVDAEEKGG
ncbi:MAG: hypothetical protein GY832_25070 [Chloroflexi bacterium]|nr:hypothetical protein [Chloroflexota bacterium]